jgi:hypothetical protein
MTTPAGVCRFCGCSEYDACRVDDGFSLEVGCSWTDHTRSVCSACAPAAKAEAIAVRVVSHAYQSQLLSLPASLDFVAAFHDGFRVGWFGISKRSPASRNPWPPMRKWALKREAWTLGQRAGAEASRGYQRICGPLTNAPRREVLQHERRRSGGAPSKRTTTQVPRR